MTARAWLTGYYIVEYEQHGADRAKYGITKSEQKFIESMIKPME